MRIISVRVVPVALAFALIYAILGLAAFVIFAFSSVPTFTLPIGMVMGEFSLAVNFHLARSSGVLANALLCVGAVVSHALTGWITGASVAVCFNLVARKSGGIDAKFVAVARDDPAEKPQLA